MPSTQLNERERTALDYLISAEFPGAVELRAQARGLRVRERKGATLTVFERNASAPRADVRAVVPVEAHTRDERPWQLLLFVKEGFLDSLELVTFDVGTAYELPTVEELGPHLVADAA